MTQAAIYEFDEARDRKQLIALVQKHDDDQRPIADLCERLSRTMTNAEISALVGKAEQWSRRLRTWRDGGYVGDPHSRTNCRNSPAPAKVPLESNNNSDPLRGIGLDPHDDGLPGADLAPEATPDEAAIRDSKYRSEAARTLADQLSEDVVNGPEISTTALAKVGEEIRRTIQRWEKLGNELVTRYPH